MSVRLAERLRLVLVVCVVSASEDMTKGGGVCSAAEDPVTRGGEVGERGWMREGSLVVGNTGEAEMGDGGSVCSAGRGTWALFTKLLEVS